ARVIEQQDQPRPKPVLLRNLSKSQSTPVWQIVNIWQASKPFEELIHNKAIANEIAQLTSAHQLRLFHDQIQYKPAGTGGVNMWHQDAPYWPILSGGKKITAWIAIDDADEYKGYMQMIKASQHW